MPVAAGPFQVRGSLAASSPPGRRSCVPGTQPGRVLSSRLTFNTIAQYVRFVLTPTDGASWDYGQQVRQSHQQVSARPLSVTPSSFYQELTKETDICFSLLSGLK